MSSLGGIAARTYYRVLLLTYPREFRRRDGNEASQVFAEACRDSSARSGPLAVLRRLARASVDVPRHGLQERMQGARGPSPGRPRSSWRRALGSAIAELGADLRFAARSLRRRSGWTLAIAATLALGIGANTAIFSVIDATLLAPSPWPDADRMAYVLVRLHAAGFSVNASQGDLLRWRDELDAFERVEMAERRYVVLSHDSGARRVPVSRVSVGYLDALGIEPLAGRLLRADDRRADAAPVAVMPEGLWRALYGADTGILGKTIRLDGEPYVIVGVAPAVRGLDESFFRPLPEGAAGRDILTTGLVWLRPGVSLEEAQAQLAAVSQGADEQWGDHVGELRPITNTFWAREEFRSALLALMVAVFLVLTIACVNVANLLLAAAGTRGGELAVRAALGAGRARLVRFLMAENLLLSAIGGALGVAVAYGGIALMRLVAPVGRLGDALDRVRLDGTVLAYATIIAALAGLAFGLLPALRAAGAGQRGALQEADSRAGGGRRQLRGFMVAVETALSLVLLVAAGLTLRSFVELRFTDPGFDADRILSVWITPPTTRYPDAPAQRAFFDALTEEAARVSGIEAVTLGVEVSPPSDLVTGGEMTIEGRDDEIEATITMSMVQGGLLDFMGVPLLAGRDLDDADVRDVEVAADRPVVINQTLARRYWPEGDALGARFRLSLDRDTRWHRVVGIAADVMQRGLEEGSGGLHMYVPLVFDGRAAELLMRLRPGAAPPVAEVRALINRLDPQIPTETLETGAAAMLDSMSDTRFRAVLFGAFAALAAALAALGIFSVVAYTVVQRTAEMGIRLALGASPADVRRQMLAQGATPVLAGVAAGALLALAATRLMTSFLHGVAPTDPLTFVATAAGLLAVGLLATWVPAQRATAVDPVLALRRH